MDVTVVLCPAMLLGAMSFGVHLDKWGVCGHSSGTLGFTLGHGVHASPDTAEVRVDTGTDLEELALSPCYYLNSFPLFFFVIDQSLHLKPLVPAAFGPK